MSKLSFLKPLSYPSLKKSGSYKLDVKKEKTKNLEKKKLCEYGKMTLIFKMTRLNRNIPRTFSF